MALLANAPASVPTAAKSKTFAATETATAARGLMLASRTASG